MLNKKSNKIITDPKKIEEFLTRGVENIYPNKEELEKVLLSGKKLRIYNGIDPTGKLHIGHSVVLNKLRQLQDLGHEAIVLIGDFTARIGDPTDKMATRKPLTKEEVKKNTIDYKKLIGKILDLKKLNIRFLHNEKWTNKLKPEDILEIASHFTVSRLLERDMFQERIKAGKDVGLHEFLYPIFQAYDAVSMDVDLQIGGNDQTFNMLAGRTLMRKMKNKEKFVLTTKLLVDPTGKKMGKTEGNMINLDEKAGEMYGKIMSWSDNLIVSGFELCTDILMTEVEKIKNEFKTGKINPRDYKMKLAYEIVKIYHGEEEAKKAEQHFIKVIQKKETPNEISNFQWFGKAHHKLPISNLNIVELLVETKLATSKSEARRLIEQGGIKIDGNVVKDINKIIEITEQGVLAQKGKRQFIKVLRKRKM
ncbi:tyrosine--tRNA ligase [Candidatus Kuenenbacteria bacterium]|nr:tyrosine--tRNA ligase [Candidatus Kuenenbacteria bacterium]